MGNAEFISSTIGEESFAQKTSSFRFWGFGCIGLQDFLGLGFIGFHDFGVHQPMNPKP